MPVHKEFLSWRKESLESQNTKSSQLWIQGSCGILVFAILILWDVKICDSDSQSSPELIQK